MVSKPKVVPTFTHYIITFTTFSTVFLVVVCSWDVVIMLSRGCYSQICCITLHVFQTLKEIWVFLFHQSSKQTRYKETHVYLWLVHFDPLGLFLCFKVRCFWSPVSHCFRQWSTSFLLSFLWSFLFLSLARIKQCLLPAFNKNSTHHHDFLRFSWAV